MIHQALLTGGGPHEGQLVPCEAAEWRVARLGKPYTLRDVREHEPIRYEYGRYTFDSWDDPEDPDSVAIFTWQGWDNPEMNRGCFRCGSTDLALLYTHDMYVCKDCGAKESGQAHHERMRAIDGYR